MCVLYSGPSQLNGLRAEIFRFVNHINYLVHKLKIVQTSNLCVRTCESKFLGLSLVKVSRESCFALLKCFCTAT